MASAVTEKLPEPGGDVAQPFQRQGSTRGSMRKVLPSVPDMDTQLSMSAKLIDRKTSTPKGNHSYGPFFLEYSLLAEYNLLKKQKLPDVYVIPSASSPQLWFGVLFVRQGYYQEGIFRFSLHIPENYPDGDCPKLVFEPPIFHPLVDVTTGELDVKRGFQKWRRNVNHIWQVLLYTRRCFYKIDTKSPLNPEASVLFENDIDLFWKKVADTVQMCKNKLYDPPPTDDPHYIRFSPYQEEIHDAVRKAILNAKVDDECSTNGLSWVQQGTLQIFSKSAS